MGIPTNSNSAKSKGCAPVSSNCVVWQGPDLDCIAVCNGDSISEVIAKLASELCIIMDLVDIDSYDISCLNVTPSEQPKAFNELLQLIIDSVCASNGVTPPVVPGSDCPDDCIVDIDKCFQTTGQNGDLNITMPLVDYVRAIGIKVCDNINEIAILKGQIPPIESNIENNTQQIESLGVSKASIESLNYQVNTKTDTNAGIQYLPDALRYVENSLIETQEATGTPSQLFKGTLAGQIDDENSLNKDLIMNAIPNWVSTANTIGASLNNAWLAIIDLREAVQHIQENCCSGGCQDLYLNFKAELVVNPGSVKIIIYTNGSTGFTAEWRECNIKTKITATDTLGNVTSFIVSLLDIMNTPTGYPVDITSSSLDVTKDITVVADTCFENTVLSTTCEKEYKSIIINNASCPSVTLTPSQFAVGYQFTTTPNYSYIVNVYYAGGATIIATQTIVLPGLTVINVLPGLIPSTNYDFELILVGSQGEETPCTKLQFTTLDDVCLPPAAVSAILTT